MSTADPYADLRAAWLAAWPEALAAWGSFTRLHPPSLHGPGEAPDGVASFAWFSTTAVSVHIDLADVARRGIGDHAVAVLAHEIGHHVLSPGDLTTSALLVARTRAGLLDHDHAAGTVANLWSDLLVNDRLHRRAGVDMASLWAALERPTSVVMQMVLRTDEILWGLGPGALTNPDLPVPEREAALCARLVRAYADDPVGGAAGFATLVRGLLGEPDVDGGAGGAGTGRAGRTDDPIGVHGAACGQHEEAGAVPAGLATDPRASAPVRHPALDPRVVGDLGVDGQDDADDGPLADVDADGADGAGQSIAPADYDATLRLLGLTSDPAESARSWYREQAAGLLVPFPVRERATATEPLLGAHEPWDVGDDLTEVDWTGSLLRSPVVVPGFTTVRRGRDDDTAAEAERVPVNLDLYLDSSGSMPNPQRSRAPIALAGAVLALSALRAGARVQATTWSGPDQIAGTDGFVRDERRVLDAVVAHFGGGTSFPLPLLERTHLGDPRTGAAPTRTRPCHVAVISDDGIDTMFADTVPVRWPRTTVDLVPPERSLAARALAAADGGGTLVLQGTADLAAKVGAYAVGYRVHAVRDHDDLVRFARDFARTLWDGGFRVAR